MAPFDVGAGRRRVIVSDVLVAAWVVTWVVVGVLLGRDLYQLRHVERTVGLAAEALHETADALDSLSGVPFVGGDIGDLAARIDATAGSAVDSAAEATDAVGRASYLLALAVAVIPTVPLLAVYLPYRSERRRELTAIRRALDHPRQRELLDRYLAHRALERLPFHRLVEVSEDPWGDVAAGRFEALARAELARLGVRPADELSLAAGGTRSTGR